MRGDTLKPQDARHNTSRPRAPVLTGSALISGLIWITAARLFVVTLLFGGLLLAMLKNGLRSYQSFTPLFLTGLVLSVYVASVLFGLLLRGLRTDLVRGGRTARSLAWSQVILDLIWTTALLYVSGGPDSVFTFLFGISILLAALLLGPDASYLTAIVALLGLLAGSYALDLGAIPPPPDQSPDAYLLSPTDLTLAFLRNTIGLGLVALLAGHLSQRLTRAGGALRIAEESAASLGMLNEDIIRSLTAGLITTDLGGRLRSVNPTALEILHATEEALLSTPLTQWFPVSEVGEEKEESPQRQDALGTRFDGTTFPAGFTMTPLRDAQGNKKGKLIIFQDLTEIVELREAAERATQMATLGRLSAGLAHEIRNPLSSILGSVELIREASELSEEDKNLLGIVSSEVDRLNELVTTMLEIGKPRSPSLSQHDLRDLVKRVVDIARLDTNALPGIKLQVESSKMPIVVLVDAAKIHQLIWNLVKNALQASSPGQEISIRVLSREPTSEDPYKRAILEIEDQGIGIPSQHRDRLFETFYSNRSHGVGLGLALVKQIVDAHRGSIEVESEVGQGTTFRVTLPV